MDVDSQILGVTGRSTCIFARGVCPGQTDRCGDRANTDTNLQLPRGLELLLGEDSFRFDTANQTTITAITVCLTMDEMWIFTLSEVAEPAAVAILAALFCIAALYRRSRP